MSELHDPLRLCPAANPHISVHSPYLRPVLLERPKKKNGKHPHGAGGLKDATTDLARIDAYWTRCPAANIGIPTGALSRCFVIDIDSKSGGYDTADELQSRYGAFPATLAVQTGGGGLHLHYAWRLGGVIRNSASKLGPGVDVRGEGGYVLAPPSLHHSRNRYEWTGLDDATDIAAAPVWLLMVLVERPTTPRVAPIAPSDSEPIPEGQRNATLTQKAGALRRHGFSENEILAALEQVNADGVDRLLRMRRCLASPRACPATPQ